MGVYPGIVIRVTDGKDTADLGPFTIEVVAAPAPPPPPPPPANRAPTISGAPPATITVGLAYDFTPVASDPDGDTLTFSIANRPAWLTFNAATGRLAGTPAAANVGQYTGIVVTVSDGQASAQLGPFSITVAQAAMGQATLSWTPPTQNTDGSPLTDLAGYKVYYGRSASSLDQVVTLSNPGLTSYVVEQLSPATWHFAMTAFNARGAESNRTNPVSKTVP